MLKHFEASDIGAELSKELVQNSVTMSAIVFSRVELNLDELPFRLPKNDDATLDAFLDEFGCCLDSTFSEPVRLAYPTHDALHSILVQQLLQVLERHLCATNMNLERLLAEHRQGVPLRKGKPSAEGCVHASLLQQVHGCRTYGFDWVCMFGMGCGRRAAALQVLI